MVPQSDLHTGDGHGSLTSPHRHQRLLEVWRRMSTAVYAAEWSNRKVTYSYWRNVDSQRRQTCWRKILPRCNVHLAHARCCGAGATVPYSAARQASERPTVAVLQDTLMVETNEQRTALLVSALALLSVTARAETG